LAIDKLTALSAVR